MCPGSLSGEIERESEIEREREGGRERERESGGEMRRAQWEQQD